MGFGHENKTVKTSKSPRLFTVAAEPWERSGPSFGSYQCRGLACTPSLLWAGSRGHLPGLTLSLLTCRCSVPLRIPPRHASPTPELPSSLSQRQKFLPVPLPAPNSAFSVSSPDRALVLTKKKPQKEDKSTVMTLRLLHLILTRRPGPGPGPEAACGVRVVSG